MTALDDLRRHVADKDVVVVAGAGVSMAATNNNPLASWIGLLRNGLEYCSVRGQDRLTPEELELAFKLIDVGKTDFFIAAAEVIAARLGAPDGSQWKGWLAKTVGTLKAINPELVEAIRGLDAPILTTNYDSVLIQASEDSERTHLTWRKAEEWVEVLEGRSKAVIYLHGFWRDAESVILGARSYERVIADDPTQELLRSFGRQKHLMFVGYGRGINDPNFAPLIKWLGRENRHHSSQHFILLPDDEANSFEARAGLEAIAFGPTNEFLGGFLRDLLITRPVGRIQTDRDVASFISDFDEFHEVTDVLTPRMVAIPAGEFDMGVREVEARKDLEREDRLPLHKVYIDYRFAVSATPVTFAEWDAFQSEIGGTKALYAKDMGWGRGTRPAIHVSWQDVQIYLDWLNSLESVTGSYRLLSEAEWEYVARAGTNSKYWWGDNADPTKANYDEAEIGRTSEVRRYPPNAYGVFDTLGNVWEWVQDRYHATFEGAPLDGSPWEEGDDPRRVVRGGSWYYDSDFLECSARLGIDPSVRFNGIGFRIARTIRHSLSVDQGYGVVSVSSKRALSVSDDAAAVSQKQWRGASEQVWYLRDSGHGSGGPFLLESERDGRVLSVAEPYKRNYAQVVVEERSDSDRFLWMPHPERDGWVLENMHSHKVLDVEGISEMEGGNVIQFARHGNQNQRWWLRPIRRRTPESQG
jgi:formylglycine-generating enzyme required for sulfatase activity